MSSFNKATKDADLLLVEVCGRGDVSPGAGGGGQAGRVVHDGVPPGPHPRPRHLATHVVIGARVPALLVLVTWVNIKALLLVLEDNKQCKSFCELLRFRLPFLKTKACGTSSKLGEGRRRKDGWMGRHVNF